MRRSNPEDRRSSLAGAGAEALAGAEAVFEDEVGARVGAVLSPAGLELLSGFLGRLREAAR
ncbi:hypothetical protein Asp14428_06720 [Actinoplanes sp. NBRC 14428]|nr:hypothetical protein Asp14428_06720 [Actinoplanes sp. NBRC 14428]